MFNNRFNSTKKDPLVEAVQSAMQDGEIRRQAVAQVNEAFGVFNRNAVVREQLAAYDAAIEEAYKCMKEGEKKDEKKEDKPKADYSKMREKMVGKGKDLETTRKIVGEAKKLADKDYDKDGKVESPKDEVWGSRFRAAKMAGKMEEEQIDEISKKTLGSYIKKAASKKPYTSIHGAAYDAASGDPKARKTIQKREKGIERATDRLTREEAQIDEISKGLAGRYKDKAHASYTYSAGKRSDDEFVSGPGKKMTDASGKPKFKERSKEAQKADDKTIQKRLKGLGMAHKRLSKEEVDYSAPDRAAVTRDNKPSTPAQTNAATSGPSAADKAALASKISTMKEAVYSAKAARAGKDIGKPGKSFSKIAKSAGEKYGSEERGKKVAGAILKRIRAKHMKEDTNE